MENVKPIRVLEYKKDKSYLISLPIGLYKIDGELVETKQQYSEELYNCKDLNIKKILKHTIVERYENSTGECIEVNKYNLELLRLENEYKSDEENLDKEFSYKKFIKEWNPIYRDIITETTYMLTNNVEKLPIKTGCKYIQVIRNKLQNKNDQLFVYQSNYARVCLFKKIFKTMGYKEEKDCSYGMTEKNKIYTVKDNSLEYACAFGTYLYGSNEGKVRDSEGSLKHCYAKFIEDFESILSKIIFYYLKKEKDNVAIFLIKEKRYEEALKILSGDRNKEVFFDLFPKTKNLFEELTT